MTESSGDLKWYQGISRYQWMVLTIASLGWVFDIFEGQIFVASMRDAMPDLLGVASDDASVRIWNDRAFGFFLLGGAFGGVLFGILSDRIGAIQNSNCHHPFLLVVHLFKRFFAGSLAYGCVAVSRGDGCRG